jgi:ribosomal protein S18 acetylase RimI-like enzyme
MAESKPDGRIGQRPEVQVGVVRLAGRRLEVAAGVLARGMRDNPVHQAVFGPDPDRRLRALQPMFRGILGVWSVPIICARLDGELVGVVTPMPPGTCRPSLGQALRLAGPILAGAGVRRVPRALRWLWAWNRHHPEHTHCHLGPVAVDAHLQGRGIGSQMMAVFAARMDAAGTDAYLETDKPENVEFYGRFGFETISEATVVGTPNWFMWRTPARGA